MKRQKPKKKSDESEKIRREDEIRFKMLMDSEANWCAHACDTIRKNFCLSNFGKDLPEADQPIAQGYREGFLDACGFCREAILKRIPRQALPADYNPGELVRPYGVERGTMQKKRPPGFYENEIKRKERSRLVNLLTDEVHHFSEENFPLDKYTEQEKANITRIQAGIIHAIEIIRKATP